MAALAANAVKAQRRKAANKLTDQAMSNVNEQKQFLNSVAQKHRDSLSSISTLDSYRPEDPAKLNGPGRPQRSRRQGGTGIPEDPRRKSKLDHEDGVYQASGSANIILYVGLGMISIGLVITFVGLGDKGFRTLELKLIGPSLVGCGIFFALLRILFCTVPSCCKACCKCCRKDEETEELIYATDDPPPKTGFVVGNSTNMSATYVSDNRSRVGPYSGKSARKRKNVGSEDESDQDGDFQRKTIRTAKPSGASGDTAQNSGGSSGHGAKPISYDTYSTDTSSQFSVDIVEVAPRPLEVEDPPPDDGGEAGLNDRQLNGSEIVLNASRLQVESETA